MNTGDIFLKLRESDNKFVFFKIVYVHKDYVLIVLFDSEFEEKPTSITSINDRTILPVTEDGWMTVPVSYSTIHSWDLTHMTNEEVTDEETMISDGWLELCGPTIMEPM